MPLSSLRWSQIVPSCKHGPVPLAVVKLLLVWRRDPGTNFRISLQMWPVVELSQTKKTESVSKWIWVFIFSKSPSVKEDVNPWMKLLSPSEVDDVQSGTPLEDSMKVALLVGVSSWSSIAFCGLGCWIFNTVVGLGCWLGSNLGFWFGMKFLEASTKLVVLEMGVLVTQIWEHLIAVSIPIIPIVASITRKEEIHPFGGFLGITFWIDLIPESNFEVHLGCHVMVFNLTSLVVPSSEDGPRLVLFMLDGWIWYRENMHSLESYPQRGILSGLIDFHQDSSRDGFCLHTHCGARRHRSRYC